MPKYEIDVEITESYSIEVEAPNKEEAKSLAEMTLSELDDPLISPHFVGSSGFIATNAELKEEPEAMKKPPTFNGVCLDGPLKGQVVMRNADVFRHFLLAKLGPVSYAASTEENIPTHPEYAEYCYRRLTYGGIGYWVSASESVNQDIEMLLEHFTNTWAETPEKAAAKTLLSWISDKNEIAQSHQFYEFFCALTASIPLTLEGLKKAFKGIVDYDSAKS